MMLTHKQLRAKALANPEVMAEFEKQSQEFSLLDEFLKARAAEGLTQAEVAEKIGTTQSAVHAWNLGAVNIRHPWPHSPSTLTLWVASWKFVWCVSRAPIPKGRREPVRHCSRRERLQQLGLNVELGFVVLQGRA